MKIIGIYGFRNIATDKWYIGQSINVHKRKTNHLCKLRAGIHYNPHLQSAFVMYGEDAFNFHILQECEPEELDRLENVWIGRFRATHKEFGYNLKSGGFLTKFSEESRRKMSLSKLGKKHTAQHRAKNAARMMGKKHALGYKHTPEHRDKNRKAHLGKKYAAGAVRTPEQREKISEFMKGHKYNLGRTQTPEWCAKQSAAMKGNTNTLGMKHSEETKRKMSEAHKARNERIRNQQEDVTLTA